MCNSRDFCQGMGGGRHRLCHCCLQTVRAQVWPDRSKLFETLTVFLIFFFSHIHFLETKAPIRPAVLRLVWAFVVRMYQRRISRDKVHTIFKNSKLNVKYPRRLCRGVYSFRLSICPFVLSYIRKSFVILLINCSLSLSLLADADPECFDSDMKKTQCRFSW